MGKASKVPPLPRRAPQAAEGLTALAESSPDSGHEGADGPPGQPTPFEAPASLPRRLPGTGDRPRPPARVARPVLPESFLERVRAAAEAARREDEQASSDTAAGITLATRGSAFVPPSREVPAAQAPPLEEPRFQAPPQAPPLPAPVAEAPVAEAPAAGAPGPEPSTALPQRVRGGNDGPRPPAHVARPALSAAFLERVRAAIQADADAEAEDDSHDAGPVPLPRRDTGGAGQPQPPAGMVPPAPVAGPRTSSPGDANTEPIPVVTAPPGTTTGAQAADVAGAAPENAALAKPQTAGAAAPGARPAPPGPEAVKAPPKPKAAKRAPKPKAVTAPPQPKAAKAPPKPPPMHRVPRTGPGTEKPPKREERASRGYRMAGVLVTTVTVALLAVGFAVFHHSGGNTAGGSSAGRSGTGRSGTGKRSPR